MISYPISLLYIKDKKLRGDYILAASLFGSWCLDQNINPIIQSSILSGRNISQKASFNTTPTPAVTEATRKKIPRTNIMGIRRMPNISLYITSDTGYLGVSISVISIIFRVLNCNYRLILLDVYSLLKLEILYLSCLLKYIFQIEYRKATSKPIYPITLRYCE